MLTMNRTLANWIGTLLAILFAVPGNCDGIDAKMRTEDARLNTKINLPAAQLYVGELLERLSTQTGVSLQMNTQEEASGVLLLVCLNKVTLGEALDAVWSTLTYKGAEWRWERSGKPGAYQYFLVQSRQAKEMAGDFREQIQRWLEEEYKKMLAAARMTPEQRRQALEKEVSEIYQGDKKGIDEYFSDPRTWMALRTFEEALSPEERLRVLRGQQTATVSTDQLSQQGKDFVEYLWKEAESTEPILRSLYFETRRRDDEIVPVFYIHAHPLGGYSYLGGRFSLAEKAIDYLTTRWMQPDDKADNPLMERKLIRNAKSMGVKADTQLDQYLIELSLLLPTSLIARLPQKGNSGASIQPPLETLDIYLTYLQMFPPQLMAKWRHKMLLLSFPGWIWDTESFVPYALVKHLRQDAKIHAGFLPIRQVVKSAARLTQSQVEHLQREFPFFVNVRDQKTLLALGYHHPEMLRANGKSLNIRMRAELEAYIKERIPDKASQVTEAVAVRIIENKESQGERRIWIELQMPDGKWSEFCGFIVESYSPPSQPIIP
jgi:hypothetical protein